MAKQKKKTTQIFLKSEEETCRRALEKIPRLPVAEYQININMVFLGNRFETQPVDLENGHLAFQESGDDIVIILANKQLFNRLHNASTIEQAKTELTNGLKRALRGSELAQLGFNEAEIKELLEAELPRKSFSCQTPKNP